MTTQAHVATEAMRTLHRIHRQLADLRERLKRNPRMARAREANLQRLETQLADAKAEAQHLRVDIDKKQLQLSSSEAAVQRRQMQLREAADNREYQALKDEIAATQKTNEVLEVEILEAMERMDVLGDKIQRCGEALAKARRDLETTHHEVQQQKPLIEADIKGLEEELRQYEGALPSDFRELYLRVVRSKAEDALAPISGEFCSGCNQHVPVNMVNELLLARPVVCRSCGRLLYLPEHATAGR